VDASSLSRAKSPDLHPCQGPGSRGVNADHRQLGLKFLRSATAATKSLFTSPLPARDGRALRISLAFAWRRPRSRRARESTALAPVAHHRGPSLPPSMRARHGTPHRAVSPGFLGGFGSCLGAGGFAGTAASYGECRQHIVSDRKHGLTQCPAGEPGRWRATMAAELRSAA